MKIVAKTALLVVSLLVSAGIGFAADVKAPAPGAGDALKADAKTSVSAVKENGKGVAADAKVTAKNALVDLNSATVAELKAIPGVGDAFAGKIIAGRPYANKTQLKSRKVIPVPLYEQIKDKIIAKQPAAAEKAPAKPAAKK
jgi:DNA uptake protein ComE-like DNA-binding protein